MNQRIKKKIQKRHGCFRYHSYYRARLAELGGVTPEDMLYVIGKNIKHPHKAYVLKGVKPVRCHIKNQPEIKVDLTIDEYVSSTNTNNGTVNAMLDPDYVLPEGLKEDGCVRRLLDMWVKGIMTED